MMLDLLDPPTLGRLIGIITLVVMGAAVGYAKGFKDGRREGLAYSKSLRKQALATKREIYSLPSDIKAVK